MEPKISISVVSHSQAELVSQALHDIAQFCQDEAIEVILTKNVPESLPFSTGDFSFPVKLIENSSPLGFGANHNQAFNAASGDYFCIMNPDVRLHQSPFPALLEVLCSSNIGVVAPRVISADGSEEDSARYFPSILELFGKLAGGKSAVFQSGNASISYPDWIAGMFMLFPSSVFRGVGGFDPRYFLYYEDVDLCVRLSLSGFRVALLSETSIVHDARRTSHKNLRYLWWHISSIVRFFSSPVYWRLKAMKRNG